MRDTEFSLYETKSTLKKETAEQDFSDRITNKSESIAATSPKTAFKEGKTQKDSNPHSEELNLNKEKEVARIDAARTRRSSSSTTGTRMRPLVNSKWKELIPLLDSTGIPINKTLISLLKLYPSEKVENAIALYRNRKREKYIANPSGYFTKILEGDWASKSLVDTDDEKKRRD